MNVINQVKARFDFLLNRFNGLKAKQISLQSVLIGHNVLSVQTLAVSGWQCVCRVYLCLTLNDLKTFQKSPHLFFLSLHSQTGFTKPSGQAQTFHSRWKHILTHVDVSLLQFMLLRVNPCLLASTCVLALTVCALLLKFALHLNACCTLAAQPKLHSTTTAAAAIHTVSEQPQHTLKNT